MHIRVPRGPFGLHERTIEQLWELRARLERRWFVQHERTRAEDFYRDQHHDEHAVVLNPNPAILGSSQDDSRPTTARPPVTRPRMRIRIVKKPPAPLMDGFDVAAFRPDAIYDVDERIGYYLI